MSIFRHHPDGTIHIDDFSESLEEFLLDEPAYSLPGGCVGRVYSPDYFHRLSTGDTVTDGPFPWPDGDNYIAKKEQYRASYNVRRPSAAQELADAANLADVRARWVSFAALHNKTPAQIYTLMQGAIDGWTSLAQAKADLRIWLPALVAALGWTVMREQQRD